MMDNKLIIMFLLLIASILLISENSSASPAPPLNLSTPLPDLIFTNLNYKVSFLGTAINSSNATVSYWNVSIIGRLKNVGIAPATSSLSSSNIMRVGGNSAYGHAIPSTALISGGSTSVLESFVGYTGQYSFGMVADTLSNIAESNETNNWLTTVITLR